MSEGHRDGSSQKFKTKKQTPYTIPTQISHNLKAHKNWNLTIQSQLSLTCRIINEINMSWG